MPNNQPKKIFCSQCGTRLQQNAQFCDICGHEINSIQQNNPLRPTYYRKLFTITVISVLIMYFFVSRIINNHGSNTTKQSTQTNNVQYSIKKYVHNYTNIRSGPGTNYKIVGSLNSGEFIRVKNINHKWTVVYRYGDSLGFVFSELLKDEPPPKPEIVALVNFTGTQFVISNLNNFDWNDIEIDVNYGFIKSGYIYRANKMRANTAYEIGAMQFAKKGARFNPFTMKPEKIKITINRNRTKDTLFWYGSFN